jgi:hypothetical protein
LLNPAIVVRGGVGLTRKDYHMKTLLVCLTLVFCFLFAPRSLSAGEEAKSEMKILFLKDYAGGQIGRVIPDSTGGCRIEIPGMKVKLYTLKNGEPFPQSYLTLMCHNGKLMHPFDARLTL